MKRHLRGSFGRGRANRRQRPVLSAAVLETLEDRRMLTVVQSSITDGPAVFTYQQAPDPAEFGDQPARTWVQVNQTGNTTAELIGATVDQDNNVILTDIPGSLTSPFVPNGAQTVLGGIGGYTGGYLIGPINITDPFHSDAGPAVTPDPLPNPGGLIGTDAATVAVGAQDNKATNVASSPNGTLATVNVTHNGRVEVMNYNTAANNGNAQTQVRINEATLFDDRFPAVVFGGASGFVDPGTVTDTAMDPLVDPASGHHMLYVLSMPDPASTNNLLTVIDVEDNKAVAQSTLSSDLFPGRRLSGSQAMAFRPGGATGRELWISTPDYDSDPTTDSNHIPVPTTQSAGAGNGAAGPVALNPGYDAALVRVNSNIASATFGHWGAAGDVQNIVDSADGFKKKLDGFTAMTWDQFDLGGVFICSFQQPVSPTGNGGGGGGGNGQVPPWDLYTIPLAAAPIGNIVQYTDWGAVGVGGNGGGGGGGGGGGAGAATLTVNGLTLSRNAQDNVILVGLVQITPTTAGDPVRGQLLQLGSIVPGGAGFLPLAPGSASAMCRAGMAVQSFGLTSSPAITTTGLGGTRPFLYSYQAGQIIRGSSIYLPVNAADGTSQVSLVEAAAFNPIDPNRL
ncbi:MAG: hypothetical protein ACHRHE_19640, partial [Tepidisphaerales bacterium]